MCGRFIVSYTYDQLVEFLNDSYQITELDIDYNERYNIAPGQKVLSVIKQKEQFKAGYLDWGFVPPFAKDLSYRYKMINARSETVHELVSFKESLKNKRCLILANGFYEWRREGNKKTPYFFQLKEDKMFAFAGLWTMNDKVSDGKLFTTTIITTTANLLMSEVHHRMPVILELEDAKKWLDQSTSDEELLGLLKEYDSNYMKKIQVSDYVNKSTNEGKRCIEPFMDGQYTLI